MRISVTTVEGDVRPLEVNGSLLLVDLKALIEMEFNIPNAQLLFNGQPLNDLQKTLVQIGIQQDDILLVSNQPTQPPNMAERMRQEMLRNPQLMSQISRNFPALANAALNNPSEFARLFEQIEQQRQLMQQQQRISDDPFDVEAQRKIEEMIRKENVAKNMEAALEHHPESFSRVHMLYVECVVNGHFVKAFVDSGAQATIMSPDCAKRCNIWHLVDERFAGIAKGVGTAKILGKVHSASIKIGNQFLPCSFTIMEGKGVELLFGLDMLKRHLACIDLNLNVLRINNENIRFLDEHELPKNEDEEVPSASKSAPPHPPTVPAPQPTMAQKYSEDTIRTLMDLGVSRNEAIAALDACNGNAELAANMLFQM